MAPSRGTRIFEMPYPMYVMPVKEALELTRARPHQDLLEERKLVEYREGMEVIFVSHQWVGLADPDPQFAQFQTFQQTLKALIEGSTLCLVCAMTAILFGQKEPTHLTKERCKALAEAYVWYDFFCVPQIRARSVHQDVGADLQKAVDSIPGYIENSKHFFILAPPLRHADRARETLDYTSWESRGWCRMELIAQVMAAHHIPTIKLNAPGIAAESFGFEWVYNGPRTGNFSVESDRAKVEGLMSQALAAKLKSLRGIGELFHFRFFSALRAHMDQTHAYETSLTAWLEAFGFEGETDKGTHGWGPMHLAALEGNVAILKALAARGCEVDARTTTKRPDIYATPGLTPLQVAAMYNADPCACVRTCEVLLDLGADPRYRTEEDGFTVLQSSCLRPDGSACKLLLERGALADLETPSVGDIPGQTPLMRALCPYPAGSNAEAAKLLLAHGANARAKDPSGIPILLHCVAGGPGSLEVLKMLLAAGADPNVLIGGQSESDKEATRVMKEAHSSEYVKGAFSWIDVGPLHFATIGGQPEVVRALLEAGGDPALPIGPESDWLPPGKTCLDLAKMFGVGEIERVLLEATTGEGKGA